MTHADLYLRGDTWLHRTDARVKLLFMLAALVFLLLYQNLLLMSGALALLLLLHVSADVPGSRLLGAVAALAPVSLLMFALRTAFYPQGSLLFTLGPLRVTAIGAAQGGVVGLRLLAMALAVLLWLFTTESRDVVRSFLAFGVPYSWGLAFSLALHYLPAFAATFTSITHAQEARALDLNQGGRIEQVRRRMPVFIPMLISVLRDGERLAIALEARGFGAEGERTDLRPLQFQTADFALLVGLLLAFGTLFWLRLALGFGSHPLRPFV